MRDKMREKLGTIRIREIKKQDLEWMDYVDVEHEDFVVPCFRESDQIGYSAFLRPSLDILYFRKLCEARGKTEKENYIFRKNDVEYTDAFLVVDMGGSRDKKTMEQEAFLYWYGIYECKDASCYVKYVEYKRSGNAAKEGKHIFIREDFYGDMMNWTWMGFPPKDSKASLSYVERKAYEALVNSNIRDTVRILPGQILLIDDVKHAFDTTIAKVTEKEGTLSLERCRETVENELFDGECLLDESLFAEADMDDGMMLLRNFFFKSCGFRTDIQGYYREYFGAEYETAKVKDWFGRSILAKNIRMIVTPSSLKLFKFYGYFGACEMNRSFCRPGLAPKVVTDAQIEEMERELGEKNQKEFAYDLWCAKLKENDGIFGVVKHEERHTGGRKFTYQMINSMNFSREDVRMLAEQDVNQLIGLITDYDAYEAYVGAGWSDEDEISYTGNLFLELATRNPVFRQTALYKNKRKNDIAAFRQKLYKGRLSIDAEYCTLCSMPYELLRCSVMEKEEAFASPVLKKGEVHIAGMADGEKLVMCRNPHTCASNVVCATNRELPELTRWFHFQRKDGYSNIVVLSPWEWDVMEALNGADFDSDEALCIREPLVIQRAGELAANEQIAAVPHMYIRSDARKKFAPDDFEKQYRMDMELWGNHIGVISNYAQILNGYYWDSFSEGSRFAGESEKIYADIQILSVLMGVEIDKAKHAYAIDAKKAAREIMMRYADEEGKLDRPIYMCMIDKFRHGEAVKKAAEGAWLSCPLDYLAEKIYTLYEEETCIKERKRTPTVALEKLFVVEDYKGCDTRKTEAVLDKMNTCIRRIQPLNINKADLGWAENQALKTSLLDDTYRVLQKNKISLKDMKRILFLVFETDCREQMKHRGVGSVFYKCLAENNGDTMCRILGAEKLPPFRAEDIREAAGQYIEEMKCGKNGRQINYAKCSRLFEEFLKVDRKDSEAVQQFASRIKVDKNPMNIAYMMGVIAGERSYADVVKNKLSALAILYHVWPELLLACVKNAEN